MNDKIYKLINNYINDVATASEVAELNALLVAEPEVVRAFAEATRLDSRLYVYYEDQIAVSFEESEMTAPKVFKKEVIKKDRSFFRYIVAPLAFAASIAVIVGVWMGYDAKQGEVVATIEEASGRGTVFVAKDGERMFLHVGDNVFGGDLIETEEKGTVVLAYAVGARTELGAGSSLRVERYSSKLEKGSLSAEVAKQPVGRPFIVETPQALVTVMGTRFSLKVNEEFLTTSRGRGKGGATRLDMNDGLVTFTRLSDGKSIDVAAGQYAMAADGVELVAIDKVRSGYVLGPIIFEDNFDKGLGNWELLVGNDVENLDLPQEKIGSKVLLLRKEDLKDRLKGILSGRFHDVAILNWQVGDRMACLRTKVPITEEAFSITWFVVGFRARGAWNEYMPFPGSHIVDEQHHNSLPDSQHPISYCMRWDCVPAGRAADGSKLLEIRRFMKSSFKPEFQDEQLCKTSVVSCDDRRMGIAFYRGEWRIARVEVRRLVRK